MRTFWSIIAIAILASAILWFLEDQPSGLPSAGGEIVSPLRPPSPASTSPADEPRTTSPNTSAPDPTSSATVQPEADVASDPPASSLEAELLASAEQREDLPGVTSGESTEANGPANSETEALEPGLDLGLDRTIPHATITPGRIIQRSPDELEADGEFTLTGTGTREDPYLPSWEYLFSAGTTYKPRLGEDTLPQRIALLDGTWVTISGHTAFPLVTGQTDEMLVMLNQWDGCCLGVPPTPFDAIEVRLQEAVKTGPKHSFNYGTITGRMKVDPYLIENWLVGLYILEESDLQNDL
ncbi:MAG: hypothetical protein CBC35_09595 [Planctomycetes bacterium TMED75]|nr:hypothetical protein [Planctomycetaceae bacterium]OUU91402.1 MAG: hypothetical protein CBC35_09595 [Planctomycetes bacterium TMED75]